MIGSYRERRFIKSGDNIHALTGKERWSELEKFLNAELAEREAYILNEKVKKSMFLDKRTETPKTERKEEKRGHLGNTSPDNPKVTCHICGESEEHVLSKTVEGSFDYVSCKKIVEMSPRERSNALFQKRS